MDTKIKIEVLVRVEPGSLGPDGSEQVEAFCELAQKLFRQKPEQDFEWTITPRYDKTLAEFSLRHQGRSLNIEKAEQVLSYYKTTPEDLEHETMDKISDLIDRYLNHKKK